MSAHSSGPCVFNDLWTHGRTAGTALHTVWALYDCPPCACWHCILAATAAAATACSSWSSFSPSGRSAGERGAPSFVCIACIACIGTTDPAASLAWPTGAAHSPCCLLHVVWSPLCYVAPLPPPRPGPFQMLRLAHARAHPVVPTNGLPLPPFAGASFTASCAQAALLLRPGARLQCTGRRRSTDPHRLRSWRCSRRSLRDGR